MAFGARSQGTLSKSVVWLGSDRRDRPALPEASRGSRTVAQSEIFSPGLITIGSAEVSALTRAAHADTSWAIGGQVL